MRLKRTATLALLAAAVAAWLAAAVTTGRRIAPAQPAPQMFSDEDSDDLAAQVARLHERLVPIATPRHPSRDLFRFSAPPPKAAQVPAPPAASSLAGSTGASAPPAVPLRPAVKLAGIAEDVRPEGVVRTAIISTQGQLFLVKEGEAVTARFRVSRIAADVVELIDLSDDSIFRLPLK